jgi:AraC family transcriptional regulator, regulatory protein of adaptative response / methylated-DNA-[protein]-cysteine methyltransferase
MQPEMKDRLNADDCWRAVTERDGQELFFYAVRSTGVYCRPSCPSRRPRRENVQFFRAPDDAERAGYRPCKRCRPRDSEVNGRAAMVAKVCKYLEQATPEDASLNTLSRRFGMSPFHLHRVFKSVAGITPREYADACRVKSLKQQLHHGQTVTDAMYEAGYGSSRGLYEGSNERLGMTPGSYRDGAKGVFIRYTTLDSPVGRMLVAATDKGVCSIQFGSSESDLLRELKREFPLATLRRGEIVLRRWIRALLDQLHGQQPQEPLPLDIRATAFQRRVWEHLRAIPYGQTESYSEVAAAVGDANASRAVARACASNPVAVAIPCHRVVRRNGSLGGYRWGIKRKRKLLEIESGKPARAGS